MKKIAVVNKNCYRIKNNAYATYVIESIKKDIGADIVFTDYLGHAEKVVRDSAHYDIIIAVGGDGTVSEVVNGMNHQAQVLSIIPIGTGNGLAHDLGILSLKHAFKAIKKNEVVAIDLIDCRFENDKKKFKKYAISTSGLGFASETAAFGNRFLKMTGPFCYSLSGCFKFFNQKKLKARVQINSSPFTEIEFTNLFVNNTKYAGNIQLFPEADIEDSVFNVLFAKTNAITQCIGHISVIAKIYPSRRAVKTASDLNIILQSPSPLMVDGEIFNSVKEIRYSIAPKRLRVLR